MLKLLIGILLAGFLSVSSFAATNIPLTDQQLVDKAQKLSQRLDELEVQKALNKVALSGTLINRYELLDSTNGVPGTPENRNSIRAPISYLALNADANVSKNIKVYSTLAFSKFWQQENRYESYSSYSASETGSFGLGGSVARFDRAYATYSFDRLPLTIAAGRMATNNGEPINQLDGLARIGTYPRLAYNGIFDGIAVIYDFSRYLKKNNTFVLRAFMTPYSNVSMTNRTLQESDVDNNGNGVTVNSSTPQWALLGEYTRNKSSWLEKLTFDFFMYNYYSFYNDGNTGSQQSSPILTGGNVPPGNGSYNETARAESLYLGLENLGYIGLNFDVNALFVHSSFPDVGYVLQSAAYLINLNQQFESYHNLIIGGEYIHTDANYYLDEYAALNLIPFYQSANSHGYHIYASMPVVNHLIVRLGMYHLHTDPAISIAGLSQYVSATNETNSQAFYAQARIDF